MPFSGASATVLAALIAGAITFLAAVFTKESKVSEFRQQWIDALREDISELISVLCYLAHEYDQLSKRPDKAAVPIVLDRIKPQMIKIQQLHARIELRLNPTEHDNLLRVLGDFVQLPALAAMTATEQAHAIRNLINVSQSVLKKEWRVVKRGEVTYRWVKRLSFIALVAAVTVFAVFAWRHQIAP